MSPPPPPASASAVASNVVPGPFTPTDGAEIAIDPLRPESSAADIALLKKIQGNLMKSHGRPFVRLVLFRFDSVINDPSLRALLCDAVSDNNVDAVGAKWKVTSGYQQWEDARNRAAAPGQPFYGLGISYAGLKRCGYADDELPLNDTQTPPNATGFSACMNNPAVAGVLGDRVSTTTPLLPDWEAVYRDGFDGVWLLAHADPLQLDVMERRVTDFLTAHRAIKVAVEGGFTWTDIHGKAREPFGFRDGISDPFFFYKDCYREDPADPTSVPWVPRWVNIPRSQVLITGGPHDGGSFLALRKLEQNVKAFRDTEQAIQGSYSQPAPGALLPDQAGALLVGRNRDGTPLAEPTGPSNANIDQDGPNRFNFSTDEKRCPFHAHIRKSAPRVPYPPPGPPPTPQVEVRDARTNLFVRRSAIYDTYGQLPPNGTLTDDPAAKPSVMAKSYTSRDGGVITEDVGLLFMGYMSNIILQFQKLQSDWFGGLNFPFAETGLGDPVIRYNAALGSAKPPPWTWPMLPQASVTLPETVTPKGGAYFYVPSIAWLQQQTPPPERWWVKIIEWVAHWFSRRGKQP